MIRPCMPGRFGLWRRTSVIPSWSTTRRNRYSSTQTQTAPTTHDSPVKPYYVTTPIFYVNADILARYARLRHPKTPVRFATGTDEHGLKIQQAAEKLGTEPQVFCDRISERFRELAKVANASNTDFIRTTSAEHKRAVQHLWRTIEQAGYIYKGSHSGWYAVSDECFYTESQIEERRDETTGEMRNVAIESGSSVEWTEEENYKFRLGAFKERLIDWLETSETSVHPTWLRASLLNTLRTEPLADLSISRPRSRLTWGIPVPGDEENHTIYVWVDALTNYLTVLGYPWVEGEGSAQENARIGREMGWPADVHVVGKDIVRFHAIYWPALLMAASLPPPRQVLAHAHWTMGNAKMSKSRGNVADPIEAMQRPGGVGVDGLRWYLMRNGGSLSNDADYSNEELQKQYSLLATRLGNLVGRISSPKIQKRFLAAAENALRDGSPMLTSTADAPEQLLSDMLVGLRDTLERRLTKLEITAGMQDVMDVVLEANRLFTLFQPWSSTTSEADLITAMVYAHGSLRITGIALQPVMPTKMKDLLDRLGVEEGDRGWDRLQLDAGVEQMRDVLRCVRVMMDRAKDLKKAGVLFPPLAEEPTSGPS
ncbi:hypothetical protein QFC21_002508 [Naganishia friedmannii]|uniref:Uncharacterized protein n=1 Tax=Naganishia friedmannii TaxID=89922 RepID=A0ACC2VVD0_9TREE|nr:hypothetical protein QFC21_002508 [Naganishia friedmannii]